MKADLSIYQVYVLTLALEKFVNHYDFEKNLKHPHSEGLLQDSFSLIESAIKLHSYLKSLDSDDCGCCVLDDYVNSSPISNYDGGYKNV